MESFCIYIIFVLCAKQTVSSGIHCHDWQGKVIQEGDQYMPDKADPCMTCICHNGFPITCKSVMCSPPSCTQWEQLEGECCSFHCIKPPEHGPENIDVNGTYTGDGDHVVRENDAANLGLRLVASTVTSFLIVALLVFMFHRLRQRRLLILMRRHQAEHQEDDQTVVGATEGYLPHLDTLDIEFPPYEDPPPPYSPPKPPDSIPQGEAPPPYEEREGERDNQRLINGNTPISANGDIRQQNGGVSQQNGCPVNAHQIQQNGSIGTMRNQLQPNGYPAITRNNGVNTGCIRPPVTTRSSGVNTSQQNNISTVCNGTISRANTIGLNQSTNDRNMTPPIMSRDSEPSYRSQNNLGNFTNSCNRPNSTVSDRQIILSSSSSSSIDDLCFNDTQRTNQQKIDQLKSDRSIGKVHHPSASAVPSPSHVIVRMHNNSPRTSLYRADSSNDTDSCIASTSKAKKSKKNTRPPHGSFIKRSDSMEIKRGSSSPRISFCNPGSGSDVACDVARDYYTVDERMTQSCHEPVKTHCDKPSTEGRQVPTSLPMTSYSTTDPMISSISSAVTNPTSSSSSTSPSSPLLLVANGSVTPGGISSQGSICSETGEAKQGRSDRQMTASHQAGIVPYAIPNDVQYPQTNAPHKKGHHCKNNRQENRNNDSIVTNGIPRRNTEPVENSTEQAENSLEPMEISTTSTSSTSSNPDDPLNPNSTPPSNSKKQTNNPRSIRHRLIYRHPDDLNLDDDSSNSSPSPIQRHNNRSNPNVEEDDEATAAVNPEKRDRIKRRESPETFRRLSRAWTEEDKYKQYGFIDPPGMVEGSQEVIDLPVEKLRSASKERRRRSKERRRSSGDRKGESSSGDGRSIGRKQKKDDQRRQQSTERTSRKSQHSENHEHSNDTHLNGVANTSVDTTERNGVEGHQCNHHRRQKCSQSPGRKKSSSRQRQSYNETVEATEASTQVDNSCLHYSTSVNDNDVYAVER